MLSMLPILLIPINKEVGGVVEEEEEAEEAVMGEVADMEAEVEDMEEEEDMVEEEGMVVEVGEEVTVVGEAHVKTTLLPVMVTGTAQIQGTIRYCQFKCNEYVLFPLFTVATI